MKKITQDTIQSSLTSLRTVKDYLHHVDFNRYELPRMQNANALILGQLPPMEQRTVRGILEKESAITYEVVQRYTERRDAVAAPNKTPEQKQLMSKYKLYSETRGTSLWTLGLNKEFNHVSEKDALQKDFAEVTGKHAYDPNEGRAILDSYGLKNIYKI